MTWEVKLTAKAREMLTGIADKRVQRKLVDRIKDLSSDPEKQGKALVNELSEYRVVRAVGQRYRIIYQLKENEIIVVVVALGIRKNGHKKDIYALAKKLIRQGLLDSDDV
jgi:mRNA interferase RelE/StbE